MATGALHVESSGSSSCISVTFPSIIWYLMIEWLSATREKPTAEAFQPTFADNLKSLDGAKPFWTSSLRQDNHMQIPRQGDS